jgi:hypothetical protein
MQFEGEVLTIPMIVAVVRTSTIPWKSPIRKQVDILKRAPLAARTPISATRSLRLMKLPEVWATAHKTRGGL